MTYVLSFRWRPASTMWRRGYPIAEIATILDLPVAEFRRRLKHLQHLYPAYFPKRRGKLLRITDQHRTTAKRAIKRRVMKRVKRMHAG